MKIRHVLPGDNLYACYIINRAPYAQIKPVIHQALVTRSVMKRTSEENAGAGPVYENEDQIIGFVLDGKILPADEVPDHVRFLGYQDPSQFPKQPDGTPGWDVYRQQLFGWGRAWEKSLQPEAEPPEQIKQLWAEDVPEGV